MTPITNPFLVPAALALAALAAMPANAQEAPTFGDGFWKLWGDGQAELAGYELTLRRYGEVREGTAVTIFVTEAFSNRLRVKADPGKHPPEDTFQVMKLNLVKDFPTGVYDYNMMLSSFAALSAVNGRPAGALTKVSFSSQEWCGHVFHQLLFDREQIRQHLHSYFDGEADQDAPLPTRPQGLSEDGLWHWARGFSGPLLAPGQEREVPLLPGTQRTRLGHLPMGWRKVTLARAKEPTKVQVPAGTFEVDVLTAKLDDGETWTFHVERAQPQRIVQWSLGEDERGRLLASKRLKYWQHQGSGQEALLRELGLAPRPPRTP